MFYFIAFGWIIGIACMGQAFTSILELSLPVNILLFIFLFLELIFYRKISTYLFKSLFAVASRFSSRPILMSLFMITV